MYEIVLRYKGVEGVLKQEEVPTKEYLELCFYLLDKKRQEMQGEMYSLAMNNAKTL